MKSQNMKRKALMVWFSSIVFIVLCSCYPFFVFAVTQYGEGEITGTVEVDGTLGIGTATPLSELTLYASGTDDAFLSFDIDGTPDWYAGVDDSDGDRFKFGAGLTVGTNQFMRIATGGNVGIGTNTNYQLDVYYNNIGYAVRVFNDGNAAANNGLMIQCGQDAGSGTLISLRDGDGTAQGTVTFSGGTVTYGAFTGNHNAIIPVEYNTKGYPYGTVMSLQSVEQSAGKPNQVDYYVVPSTEPYDTTVFGVYAGKQEGTNNKHIIYALGDGNILVVNEGGNIKSGDYLTTSAIEGHAMKQDDDSVHNYTIAKALETVNWENEESAKKRISCTYHAQ